jgi:hypothetical protein
MTKEKSIAGKTLFASPKTRKNQFMRYFTRSRMIAVALAILAIAAVGPSTQAAEPDAAPQDVTGMPQPVERASTDDCAIIVEVGKRKMDWGATPPDFAFYPEFDRDGGGTYLEDCPWKQLGVAEPLTKAQKPDKGFFITRPRYSGTSATVELQLYISAQGSDGKRLPPYLRSETCSLEKQENRWQLRECKLKAVT